MFESIDVINDLRVEVALARESWRRRHAFRYAAQGRGALKTATRTLEGITRLRCAVLEELRLVGVHVVKLRA
jgi:hypothetical protein